MLLKVRAFAGFREILGKELKIELEEGSTVKDSLGKLAEGNKRFMTETFDESGNIRDHVLIMLNRKRINTREDFLTEIKDGDELAIFPPVAGG